MIPSIAHFIWFGDSFPWACTLAIRSALRFGGFERAILHHEATLRHDASYEQLSGLSGLQLRVMDEQKTLEAIGDEGENLFSVYRQLEQPAARANVMRAALLLEHGGVYLDADTITVRDLGELRSSCSAFVGEERIALPFVVRQAKNPLVLAAAGVRRTVRDVFRRLPTGWRSFRRLERFYPRAANNAVLGAEANHPLLMRLTRAMLQLEPAQRTRRFALGTHLLQRVVAAEPRTDFRLLAPEVFYPLGPEISEHWFRIRRQLPRLEEVVLDDTLVVHWYASVRTRDIVPVIDRAYVERHRHEQLFSALAARVLDEARASVFP